MSAAALTAARAGLRSCLTCGLLARPAHRRRDGTVAGNVEARVIGANRTRTRAGVAAATGLDVGGVDVARRVRQEAQFELADRGAMGALDVVGVDLHTAALRLQQAGMTAMGAMQALHHLADFRAQRPDLAPDLRPQRPEGERPFAPPLGP